MKKQSFVVSRYTAALLGVLVLVGLYLTRLYSYALFHSLVELFSIIVACGIFIIAWNSRRFMNNNYLLFIGIAYLFIGGMDLVHTLAYKGMGIFQGYEPTNLAAQLWISARYINSISLLIAPLFLRHKLRTNFTFVGYAAVVFLLLASIFYWRVFPQCFVEGVGLTAFKIISEYVISLILLGAIGLLLSNRRGFDAGVVKLLVAAMAVTIGSEMAFTLYADAYGLLNMAGHFLKLISFYLIYRAIIETGLTKPYNLLFRNLKQSEETLRKAKDELEIRVEERTYDLNKSNEQLRQEITERKQREERIVHLSGVLRAVRNVNQLITHEKDRGRLIQKSCDLLVERHGYERSWILLLDEGRNPVSVATAGFSEEVSIFMEQLKMGNYTECLKELLSQEKQFLAYDQPGTKHRGCVLAEIHSTNGVFRCKLEYEGKLYGVLGVKVSSMAVSDKEEQSLFLELCGDIAFALASIEREEQRKQAEEALIKSEEKCRAIFDSATDGILLADPETKKFFAGNRTICQMLGYSGEEIKNIGVMGIHPEGEVSQVIEKFEKQTKREVGLVLDIPVKRKDGSVFYADINSAPVTFAGKTYLMGMFRDATERRRAEAELRDSEQKFRALAEQSPNPIYINQKGKVVYANKKSEEITGFKREEFYSPNFNFLTLIAPKYVDLVKAALRKHMNGEDVPPYECGLVTKEGKGIDVVISTSFITYDGEPAILGMITDITERKRMQEQLIITDRLASVGELASGIAHELNNPLTGVIGLSQLLLDRINDEDVKEDLKLVNSEAQRAAKVVKNMLTFARKHPVARQLVNVNTIIQKVLELRAYEQGVSNIQVITHFASNLPEIMADDFQLQQVFLNIIINAEYFMVQAHNKGILTIATEKAKDAVKASFSDDGPGIPKENLEHLFDPFFTTKEVGKGTGLGLSICHGIVTAHGGRIFAESELGKGATFVVELPISLGEGTK